MKTTQEQRDAAKEWRRNHPGYNAAYMRKYRATHPEYYARELASYKRKHVLAVRAAKVAAPAREECFGCGGRAGLQMIERRVFVGGKWQDRTVPCCAICRGERAA